MKPVLVFAALIAVSPAFAADAAADKKSKRTLKEVIDLAMKDGVDDTLTSPMAEKFGLGSVDYPEKKLRFKQSKTPDKHEHAFSVVLKKTDSGLKPIALEIITGTGSRSSDGQVSVDAVGFLASIDGKLQSAYHNHGIVPHLVPDQLSTKSAAVKRQFKDELDFHLKTAKELGLEPAR